MPHMWHRVSWCILNSRCSKVIAVKTLGYTVGLRVVTAILMQP